MSSIKKYIVLWLCCTAVCFEQMVHASFAPQVAKRFVVPQSEPVKPSITIKPATSTSVASQPVRPLSAKKNQPEASNVWGTISTASQAQKAASGGLWQDFSATDYQEQSLIEEDDGVEPEEQGQSAPSISRFEQAAQAYQAEQLASGTFGVTSAAKEQEKSACQKYIEDNIMPIDVQAVNVFFSYLVWQKGKPMKDAYTLVIPFLEKCYGKKIEVPLYIKKFEVTPEIRALQLVFFKELQSLEVKFKKNAVQNDVLSAMTTFLSKQWYGNLGAKSTNIKDSHDQKISVLEEEIKELESSRSGPMAKNKARQLVQAKIQEQQKEKFAAVYQLVHQAVTTVAKHLQHKPIISFLAVSLFLQKTYEELQEVIKVASSTPVSVEAEQAVEVKDASDASVAIDLTESKYKTFFEELKTKSGFGVEQKQQKDISIQDALALRSSLATTESEVKAIRFYLINPATMRNVLTLQEYEKQPQGTFVTEKNIDTFKDDTGARADLTIWYRNLSDDQKQKYQSYNLLVVHHFIMSKKLDITRPDLTILYKKIQAKQLEKAAAYHNEFELANFSKFLQFVETGDIAMPVAGLMWAFLEEHKKAKTYAQATWENFCIFYNERVQKAGESEHSQSQLKRTGGPQSSVTSSNTTTSALKEQIRAFANRKKGITQSSAQLAPGVQAARDAIAHAFGLSPVDDGAGVPPMPIAPGQKTQPNRASNSSSSGYKKTTNTNAAAPAPGSAAGKTSSAPSGSEVAGAPVADDAHNDSEEVDDQGETNSDQDDLDASEDGGDDAENPGVEEKLEAQLQELPSQALAAVVQELKNNAELTPQQRELIERIVARIIAARMQQHILQWAQKRRATVRSGVTTGTSVKLRPQVAQSGLTALPGVQSSTTNDAVMAPLTGSDLLQLFNRTQSITGSDEELAKNEEDLLMGVVQLLVQGRMAEIPKEIPQEMVARARKIVADICARQLLLAGVSGTLVTAVAEQFNVDSATQESVVSRVTTNAPLDLLFAPGLAPTEPVVQAMYAAVVNQLLPTLPSGTDSTTVETDAKVAKPTDQVEALLNSVSVDGAAALAPIIYHRLHVIDASPATRATMTSMIGRVVAQKVIDEAVASGQSDEIDENDEDDAKGVQDEGVSKTADRKKLSLLVPDMLARIQALNLPPDIAREARERVTTMVAVTPQELAARAHEQGVINEQESSIVRSSQRNIRKKYMQLMLSYMRKNNIQKLSGPDIQALQLAGLLPVLEASSDEKIESSKGSPESLITQELAFAAQQAQLVRDVQQTLFMTPPGVVLGVDEKQAVESLSLKIEERGARLSWQELSADEQHIIEKYIVNHNVNDAHSLIAALQTIAPNLAPAARKLMLQTHAQKLIEDGMDPKKAEEKAEELTKHISTLPTLTLHASDFLTTHDVAALTKEQEQAAVYQMEHAHHIKAFIKNHMPHHEIDDLEKLSVQELSLLHAKAKNHHNKKIASVLFAVLLKRIEQQKKEVQEDAQARMLQGRKNALTKVVLGSTATIPLAQQFSTDRLKHVELSAPAQKVVKAFEEIMLKAAKKPEGQRAQEYQDMRKLLTANAGILQVQEAVVDLFVAKVAQEFPGKLPGEHVLKARIHAVVPEFLRKAVWQVFAGIYAQAQMSDEQLLYEFCIYGNVLQLLHVNAYNQLPQEVERRIIEPYFLRIERKEYQNFAAQKSQQLWQEIVRKKLV